MKEQQTKFEPTVNDINAMMKSDIWLLPEFDFGKSIQYPMKCYEKMDFGYFRNESLKKEVKEYIIHLFFEHKVITYINTIYKGLSYLLQFIDETCPDAKSITEVDNLQVKFSAFWNKNKSTKMVNGNMPTSNYIRAANKFLKFIYISRNASHGLIDAMEKDYWDLCLLMKASPVNYSCYCDFGEIKNSQLRIEAKKYIANLINRGNSISKIYSLFKSLKGFCSFLNEKHPDFFSLSQINYIPQIRNEYIKYLQDKGIKPFYKTSIYGMNFQEKSINQRSYSLKGADNFYKYINFSEESDNEYDKDIWDVTKLGIRVTLNSTQYVKTISFKNISQFWLKKEAKDYAIFKLKAGISLANVLKKITAINDFSACLELYELAPNSIHELNQGAFDKFFLYIKNKGNKPITENDKFHSLHSFFLDQNTRKNPDERIPIGRFYRRCPYNKREHKPVVVFSDEEQNQILGLFKYLPKQIARILFLADNLGMRIGDILNMKTDYALKKVSDGNWKMSYYMMKVKRLHSMNIDDNIANVINAAISESQESYPNCEYVFARSKDKPISYASVRNTVNKTSKKYLAEPVFIKMHQFRRTRATEYSKTHSESQTAEFLGQKGIESLISYLSVTQTEVSDAIAPAIKERELWIELDGKPTSVPNITELAVPYGLCTKKVICDHANRCLTCSMWTPSESDIPLYQHIREQALTASKKARAAGNILFANKNQAISDAYETVINKFKRNTKNGEPK